MAWWPAVFAVGTMCLMMLIDTSSKDMPWPPPISFSSERALSVLLSPWYLGMAVPMIAGWFWIAGFARKHKLSPEEQGSMVWWLTNLFWFHIACDIYSGYLQVMPAMTELYYKMTPVHYQPRWHESRAHLDSGYALEILVEVPMAAWVFYLYATRDKGRHIAEVFAASVQMAGTVTYYAPGIAKGEHACWLSWADRSCGFMWILFPLILLRRHLAAARSGKAVKEA